MQFKSQFMTLTNATKTARRVCHGGFWGSVALVLNLSACGGGEDAANSVALRRAQEAAVKPVALQQLPDLHACLSKLSQKLKSGSGRDGLSLDCLAGRFDGLTMQGEACFLQVDSQQRRFKFVFGNHSADIEWADVAMGSDGRPVHNLESSDLDNMRPGVQLTRFTPVPEAITETLALRAGLAKQGPQGLPQITYLRVHSGQPEEVRCRYGA